MAWHGIKFHFQIHFKKIRSTTYDRRRVDRAAVGSVERKVLELCAGRRVDCKRAENLKFDAARTYVNKQTTVYVYIYIYACTHACPHIARRVEIHVLHFAERDILDLLN